MKGIDVSHWQGSIDWKKVEASGIEFVFVKATEGNASVDQNFSANFRGAKGAGLKVGLYSFAHVSQDPILSADFFANTVKSVGIGFGDLPLIVDVETSEMVVGASSIDDWTIKFLDHLKAVTNHDVGLYSGEWFESANLTKTVQKYSFLWIAKYSSVAPNVKWMIWQDSESGHVDGIAGNVDIDEGVSNLLGNAVTYTPFTVAVGDKMFPAIVSNNTTYVYYTALDVYNTPHTFKGNALMNINGVDVQGIGYNSETYLPWSTLAEGIKADKVAWFFHK